MPSIQKYKVKLFECLQFKKYGKLLTFTILNSNCPDTFNLKNIKGNFLDVFTSKNIKDSQNKLCQTVSIWNNYKTAYVINTNPISWLNLK